MNHADIRLMFRTMGTDLGLLYADEAEGKSVAEILLMHHLSVSRLDLYASLFSIPDETTQSKIQRDFERLMQHEPIQYVIGKTWFAGMEFRVGPGVLIPRPETEELVQWVVEAYGSQQSEIAIFDIGTGSGCMAIALKKAMPDAAISGLDISAQALNYAQQNAAIHSTDIQWIEADLFFQEFQFSTSKKLIVVSNPPYVFESEKATMTVRVNEYEPHQALFVPDSNSLVFYKRIASLFAGKAESIFFEINPLAAKAYSKLAADFGFNLTHRSDFQGKTRMVHFKIS